MKTLSLDTDLSVSRSMFSPLVYHIEEDDCVNVLGFLLIALVLVGAAFAGSSKADRYEAKQDERALWKLYYNKARKKGMSAAEAKAFADNKVANF